VTAVPANSFVVDWKAELDPGDGQELTDLYLTDDRVFGYTGDHRSYVMSRAGGTLHYITPVDVPGGILRRPIALSDSIIYPTRTSLQIYSLDGKLTRTIALSQAAGAAPVAVGQMLYMGLDYTEGGRIAAINLEEPILPIIWQVRTGGAIRSSPAYISGSLYVGTIDGRIYGIDARDRHQLWNLEGGGFTTAGPIVADVQADDSAVYAASTDSKLYALDRANGKIRWQYYAGAQLTEAPVVTADAVYIAVPGQGLAALDKGAGKFNRPARWFVAGAKQFLSQDKTHVYLRGKEDHILAVDKQSGETVFTSRGNDYELFATNLTDSTIYAAQRNGLVVAIKPVLVDGSVGQIALAD
jgi:outer membrane protein assembly factor BamB